MGLMTLRDRALRPTALLRVMLLLSAAGALIVGLLAMHTIATPGGHGDTTHAAMTVESHDDSMLAGTAVTEGCDGVCAPAHDMGTMACILALLVSVLIVGAIHRVSPWSRSRPLEALAAVATRRTSSWALPPPDLNVLSISRT